MGSAWGDGSRVDALRTVEEKMKIYVKLLRFGVGAMLWRMNLAMLVSRYKSIVYLRIMAFHGNAHTIAGVWECIGILWVASTH